MAETKNPAKALAKPAGSQVVDQRQADDIRGRSTIARLRETHLTSRFGVRPLLAGLVAEIAYGEVRS